MLRRQGTWYLAVGALLVVYVGLRWLTLTSADHLENNDSGFYLLHMDLIRTGGWSEILHIDPTVSLFYVLLGAGISALGFPTELAGRLVSLVASVGLFFVVYGLGRRLQSRQAALFGLCLLTFNPVLVGMSIAALTEPLYVTVVYAGLLIFVRCHQSMSLKSAWMMGLVFGLAFLTRMEGILFLAFIPLVQSLYLWMTKKLRAEVGRHLRWSAVFAAGFLMTGAIKISLNSYNMGTLAIDGRQVWSKVQNRPDDRSHDQKIYGLDFSPAIVNIKYLERNPEALQNVAKADSVGQLKKQLTRMLTHLNLLYLQSLPKLAGVGVAIFFAVGLMVLYRQVQIFHIVFVGLFLATALSAPLQAFNFQIRILIVIAPIILVVAGIGLHSGTRFFLKEMAGGKVVRWGMTLGVYAWLGSIWLVPLVSTLRRPVVSWDYDPVVMQRVVELMRAKNASHEEVRVAAKWAYLGFFAQSRRYFVPWVGYEALVDYLRLNEIQYLCLEERAVDGFPFMEAFEGERYEQDFDLLYQTVDGNGQEVALYKFLPPVKDVRAGFLDQGGGMIPSEKAGER